MERTLRVLSWIAIALIALSVLSGIVGLVPIATDPRAIATGAIAIVLVVGLIAFARDPDGRTAYW